MTKPLLKHSISLVLAAALISSMAGCGQTDEAVEVQTTINVKVNTAKPQRGNVEQIASFTGKVMPDDSVSVFGKSAGTVLRTYFEVGDTVTEGQLLFELDPADYEIQLEQARIGYEKSLKDIDIAESGSGDALTELQFQTAIKTAENAYESARSRAALWDDFDMSAFRSTRKNYRDAYDKWRNDKSDENYAALVKAEQNYNNEMDQYDAASSEIVALESAYDNYESALQQYEIYKSTQKGENQESYDINRQLAKLQYDSMLQTMDNLKCYAPISGVIEQKNISANDTYSQSMASYVVSNKDLLVVNFSVSADVAQGMSIGDAVTIEEGSNTYNAEITEIGSLVDSYGLFPIKATISGEAKFLSGVIVKLNAITKKSENCLLVPLSAVYYDDGQPYVYIVKDGVAVRTDFESGIISGSNIEAVSGISESDVIISTWNPNLIDGVAVQISEEV